MNRNIEVLGWSYDQWLRTAKWWRGHKCTDLPPTTLAGMLELQRRWYEAITPIPSPEEAWVAEATRHAVTETQR